jgi:hypothetical protein
MPEPLPANLAKLQINFGELLQAVDFPSEYELKDFFVANFSTRYGSRWIAKE